MAFYEFPQSEPGFIESHPLDLAAGRVKVLEAYGRTFVCVFAGAPFKMSFNNGRYFDMWQGAKWFLQPNERYNTLRLLSTTDQRVVVVTGNFEYDQTSVTTVVQAARTRAFPYSANSIGAGLDIDLNTIPSGMTYRKAVVISNADAAVDLTIYTQDATGTYKIAAYIQHLQAWYLETSDNVRIHNPGGSPVTLGILETFYIAS
jgi:hypothetical protein